MVYGRENAGQLFEISISYICIKIIEFLRTNILDVSESISMLLDLYEIISPSMKNYLETVISNMSDDDMILYIQTLMDDECIYTSIDPMDENMTIQKLEAIYDKFPWIHAEKILMPIVDSMNNIRYVESRRPIIYGYQYFYRLKQYAEEKFSVTSLSSTNIKNENTRNKASNNYKALYARTPIRFGEMEIGNLTHMGADLVSQILMIYSSSPLARQLCAQLETGDPFNIDVKLDMDSKNRNAEILNVYLKTKGLKITFKKHLKKYEHPVKIYPMEFFDPIGIEPMIFYSQGEKIDIEEATRKLIETRDHPKKIPMVFYPMEFFDEVHVDNDEDDGVVK